MIDQTGTGKLRLGLTLLGSENEVSLELYDCLSGTRFLEIKMTPAEFVHAFSGRLCQMRVDARISQLQRVGKHMEMRELVFPISDDKLYGTERRELARKEVTLHCPDGWFPDTHFGSQDSFKFKEGVTYAKTTIRRWVDATEENERERS